ncbi:FecR domain-containing protein [Pontixanthobacter gangjinensis]|uniref:LysM peptidoglycan-binding domain-containing protein n=1 Tax=Pontixanthobacter gangjinensis TaxID=1028742 RepID=A0A6I4SMV1_9SPHN|nr:FecR domain-containing protein [Pontixanthobacter gangjinensis]MXO56147.1 LysM peptidoglycan-binding domain-containing protein [Pontixanthobacter gangjinensis]
MRVSLMKLVISVMIAACTALFALPASAQDDAPITYVVKKGDTLNSISDRYLTGSEAMAKVALLNKVFRPRQMPIGKKLELPRNLLRFEQVPLRVERFSGPVQVGGTQVEAGVILREGGVVNTGANGFVSFSSVRGSVVSLPSNSRARLKRARLYALDNILDVDFEVLGGRGEVTAPKLRGQERFKLRTPLAVTAVRGTQFRVAHDEVLGRSGTEVVEGEVAVSSGKNEELASAGFGIASGANGLSGVEALLPASEITNPGAIQTSELVAFAVTPPDGAVGYRTQIAREAGFLDVVAEQTETSGEVSFKGLEDGRYYVRVRAISASGLEGLSENYSFRRKRLGVTPSVGTSPLADGFKFEWLTAGVGETYYAFQLWEKGSDAAPLLDEVGVSSKGLILTNLEPGIYQWRVAAMQAESDGLLKVWGPTQSLIVSE